MKHNTKINNMNNKNKTPTKKNQKDHTNSIHKNKKKTTTTNKKKNKEEDKEEGEQ